MQTIIIQGAMPKEIQPYQEYFKNLNYKNIDGYDFYETIVGDKKIIISLTQMGIMNATIATMIAINNFKPDFILNQGTAGAHIKSLCVGDIVVATSCAYINKFKTPTKFEGQGSNPLEWKVMTSVQNIFETKQTVLEKSKQILAGQKVVYGVLGCGDMFSRETDRINYLRSIFDEQCEDMESVAVYKVCQNYGIDCLGIRVISNNELVENSGSVSENIELCMANLKNIVLKIVENI